jgi:SAM-dependent methyltransferase
MGSIAFDRAADYYDRTRRLAPDTQAAVIRMLLDELRGRGRCLEIGVGTGRMALDLHDGGAAMAGIDLSAPMLAKLVEKAGGAAPFPLAVADATALPFPDAAFAAGLVCHVLHLIPTWRAAAEELVRVVAPGGVILVDAGGDGSPIGADLVRYFFSQTPGGPQPRPGLTDIAQLDELLLDRGLSVRDLAPVIRRSTGTVGQIIDRLEAGILSRCWSLSDEERRSAAAATREWARQRFGDIDEPHQLESAIRWRVYDVPSEPA